MGSSYLSFVRYKLCTCSGLSTLFKCFDHFITAYALVKAANSTLSKWIPKGKDLTKYIFAKRKLQPVSFEEQSYWIFILFIQIIIQKASLYS